MTHDYRCKMNSCATFGNGNIEISSVKRHSNLRVVAQHSKRKNKKTKTRIVRDLTDRLTGMVASVSVMELETITIKENKVIRPKSRGSSFSQKIGQTDRQTD